MEVAGPLGTPLGLVKNLPAMWETWIQSLGWEDPLEEGMATQYSCLDFLAMPHGLWDLSSPIRD